MAQNLVKVVIKMGTTELSINMNMEEKVDEPLVFRKERKYTITDLNVYIVENYVRSHPGMFTKPFPPRYVNNIYFDTTHYLSYADNVVGAMQRKKFRIRWYGDQFGQIEKPVLEIKIKEGMAGAKRQFPLVPFVLDKRFSGKSIRTLIEQSEIPMLVKETLRHMTPTLLNQYYRKYYISADRRFRLTLDSKLTYTRISKYQNHFMRQVHEINKVIMELKYDVEYDTEYNKISNYFPFRMTKNSKYVDGVDNLDLW